MASYQYDPKKALVPPTLATKADNSPRSKVSRPNATSNAWLR
jgi:hypothetical protein